MAISTGVLSKLPLELQLLILENLEDLSTLQTITDAYPSIRDTLRQCHYDKIVYSILSKSLSTDICDDIYALVSAQYGNFNLSQDIGPFWEQHFGNENGARRPSGQVPWSPAVLGYIIQIQEAIDFFVEFCSNNMPHLSKGKTVLQRTLLRFQLFCEVFHRWEDSANSIDIPFDASFPKKSYVRFKSRQTQSREMRRIFSALRDILRIMQERSSPSRANNLHLGLPNLRAAVENGTNSLTDLLYLHWFTVQVLN